MKNGCGYSRQEIKLIFGVYIMIIMAGIIWSNKTELILKSN